MFTKYFLYVYLSEEKSKVYFSKNHFYEQLKILIIVNFKY